MPKKICKTCQERSKRNYCRKTKKALSRVKTEGCPSWANQGLTGR